MQDIRVEIGDYNWAIEFLKEKQKALKTECRKVLSSRRVEEIFQEYNDAEEKIRTIRKFLEFQIQFSEITSKMESLVSEVTEQVLREEWDENHPQ